MISSIKLYQNQVLHLKSEYSCNVLTTVKLLNQNDFLSKLSVHYYVLNVYTNTNTEIQEMRIGTQAGDNQTSHARSEIVDTESSTSHDNNKSVLSSSLEV